MTPPLLLYLGLTGVAAPAAPLLLRWRRARGREHRERWPERMGNASLPRPEGRLVWFHGASVGECTSILPLIERLREQQRDGAILVTCGTVSAAYLLAERLPKGVVHQFLPLDIEPAISRFLDHWRPDLAVCIESEIWPRLLRSLARRKIPAILLNARLSPRSQRRWRRLPRTAGELFPLFDYVQAQDASTGEVLRDLGVAPERLAITGSFKEAAAPLPCDPDELARQRHALGGRRVWVAASTHRGEEAMAVEAHRDVTATLPGALLIVVPRHPERGDEIAALLDASGLRWTRRGDGPPPAEASVYLADTLGELGLWYRLAEVTFVGGSTRGVGGHNPYEPIALDVPVLHGPDTGNFSAIYGDLDAAAAARLVNTSHELSQAVIALSGTPAASEMAGRAAQVAGGGADALDRALGAITERLRAQIVTIR